MTLLDHSLRSEGKAGTVLILKRLQKSFFVLELRADVLNICSLTVGLSRNILRHIFSKIRVERRGRTGAVRFWILKKNTSKTTVANDRSERTYFFARKET